MKSFLFLCLTLILVSIHQSSAQIACAASPANHLVDYGFEVGSTYCRNNSVDLDVDQISLCVIGYDGKNLTYDLGSAGSQVDLQTKFAPNGWTSSGEVDVITGNYQTVHGFWAAKLNGQFASGSISQSFAITTPNLQCNAAYYSATNIRAPTGFQANYSMIVSMGSTKIATLNFLGNPNDPTNPRLFTVNTPFVTLGATGTYTLSFVSNDNTPVTFTDGLFPTMTYYGRTGIVIDDICFSCLASPSPSVSPTPSAAPSTSPTSVPSQSNSPSSSPAPSVLPAPSCPAFIEDDDNWEFVPHRNDDEDSQDTTTVNVYFADILNRGRHY